jgi:isocitrate/isopropylmalate dehydrogenase
VRTHEIVVIAGDGIGPELTEAALAVLEAAQAGAGFRLATTEVRAGAAVYREIGRPISDEDLARCLGAAAVLKGPVGDPAVRAPDGTEGGVLGGVLRPAFDAYANLRPVRRWPGVTPPLRTDAPIDYLIVRENTEGLYASRGRGFVTGDVAIDHLVVTAVGARRICRKAFELAEARSGRRHVTLVDKANVLRGFAFFRQAFLEVAAGFPDVEADCCYADAAAALFVSDPGRFDVVVTENFLGDILSDLGGATIGGLGLCPSGNVGDDRAFFEPIHGSALALAGSDRANPVSMVLSAAMMLDWLGETGAAEAVRAAVGRALASGAVAVLADGTVADGTRAAARAIATGLG